MIQRTLAVLAIAARRLWHQRGMAFSLLLGLVAAVALTVSIPIYADAVSYRVLHERLYVKPESDYPPFSFLFRYVGSWNKYLEWEDCQKADTFLTRQAPDMLGLPLKMVVRHFKTDRMGLYPPSEGAYESNTRPLGYVAVGFVTDLESHIEILEGHFPTPLTNNTDPLEVLISPWLVEETGIQPGEDYVLYYVRPGEGNSKVKTTFQYPVRIAGTWRARDPKEEYWFYRQSAFREVLLVPEASYRQLAKGMKGEVGLALWSLVFDGSAVRSGDVLPLLGRIASVRNKATALLPGMDVARSPEGALEGYRRTVRLLTLVLYVFSVPIMGVILYFISLVAGVIVHRQRNEIAMLRSRGTTTGQVIGIYAMESLIVGALAMGIGVFAGERVAQVMGLTRSFLVFENRQLLATTISWGSVRLGLIAVVVAMVAAVIPAIGAARATVVTYKQELARSLRPPFWQRAFLDVLLLVPALYGYYLLKQRGTISFLENKGAEGSPFSNPYLFLVPTMFGFALALMCIRAFPTLMRILSWLANAWRGVVPVLTLRHLARTARQYTGPLLLLMLTLTLAVFTASMARTLDGYTVDRTYYEIGADYEVVELGESQAAVSGMGQGGEGGGSGGGGEDTGPVWLFLPVSEHERIPGIHKATRFWNKKVNLRLGDQQVEASMVGIDRVDFPQVAFFRRDFAPATLGALMNALAVRSDAVLVSRDIWERGWTVGEKFQVLIPIGLSPKVQFTVVGVVDFFPRLYPEDGPFIIANLNFIFDNVGGIYPYEVLLKGERISTDRLLEEIRRLGVNVIHAYSAYEAIEREIHRPDRQGVFGLLTVGFVASAVLTVLGFLIYSYVSFVQRYIELGVLRAIGLSVGQMAFFLIAEQLTLIATGVAVGTGLGVLVSRLFIPFLQIQDKEHPFTPPFVVQVAWDEIVYIYIVFGIMFLAAVVVLLLALRRMRVFEAIKLGETA